jgi:hypothetical protein
LSAVKLIQAKWTQAKLVQAKWTQAKWTQTNQLIDGSTVDQQLVNRRSIIDQSTRARLQKLILEKQLQNFHPTQPILDPSDPKAGHQTIHPPLTFRDHCDASLNRQPIV